MSEQAVTANPEIKVDNPPAEAKPDPYEGLSADERTQLEHDDRVMQSWTPQQRLAAFQYMRKGLTADQAAAQVKKDEKKADVEDDDPGVRAEKKIKELESRLDSERADAQRRAEYVKFQEDMKAEIAKHKDIVKDEDAAELVMAAATTKFFQTKDLRTAVKVGVDKLKSILDKKAAEYVGQKVEDRKVAGEGSGGRSAPKTEQKYGRNDLSSGAVKKNLEKMIASGQL